MKRRNKYPKKGDLLRFRTNDYDALRKDRRITITKGTLAEVVFYQRPSKNTVIDIFGGREDNILLLINGVEKWFPFSFDLFCFDDEWEEF